MTVRAFILVLLMGVASLALGQDAVETKTETKKKNWKPSHSPKASKPAAGMAVSAATASRNITWHKRITSLCP